MSAWCVHVGMATPATPGGYHGRMPILIIASCGALFALLVAGVARRRRRRMARRAAPWWRR